MGSRPDTAALAKRFANRFLLRLDNGALLGDGSTLGDQAAAGPIIVPADQAFALGRLGPRHASSLESKLQKAHESVPGAQPLRSVSSGAVKQRRAEAPPQQPAAKRQRTDHSAGTGVGLPAHRHGPPSPSSQNVSSWHGTDFQEKCFGMLRQVKARLASESAWFAVPVSSVQVPDYYTIITQPMDLGKIEQRLRADHYSSPKDFCEDMRLVWANCIKYNGTQAIVGKAGVKGQAIFEQLWAGSGFSDEARARRTTAGVAAPKYEPAAGIPDKKPKKLANGQPSKKARGSAKSKGGLARMRSTASHHAYSNRPMDRDRKQVLAETVQNLDESQIEAVMRLLRDAGVPQSETGECELDFDVMDNSVLWELDHLILGSAGGHHTGNGHMESDTDSDSN
ncbi:hypothetical protein WJX74_006433 [Apatococcus lobatus]|uniref:Uncharacterized protein n=1 Tax=Apatococcus lobatus TaxID=904363 RepID=A0AAW1QYJ6_9CHLO